MDSTLRKRSNGMLLLALLSVLIIGCDGCHGSHRREKEIEWADQRDYDQVDYVFAYYHDYPDSAFTYPDGTYVLRDGMKCHRMNEEESSKAKRILRRYFEHYEFDNDRYLGYEPYRLRKYFRQYLAFEYRERLYVLVNLFTHYYYDPENPHAFDPILTTRIENYGTGGIDYGMLIIDLEKEKVVFFRMNNEIKAGEDWRDFKLDQL